MNNKKIMLSITKQCIVYPYFSSPAAFYNTPFSVDTPTQEICLRAILNCTLVHYLFYYFLSD